MDRSLQLGEAVRQALERLVRERLSRKQGAHLIESRLPELELRIRLALGTPGQDASGFGADLVALVDELLEDAIQQEAAFRPGHVWCHRCENAVCEHSRPPSSRHVFTGYAPTGLPSWEDFAQVCLERKHPGVDRLYADPPALVTLVQGRDALSGQMLAAFDKGSYELLGQLVAGFFPVKARAEEGRGIVALTVQVAASRTRRGKRRLGLNLLGRTPAGDDLDRLWDRHTDLPWRKPVRWAQSALQTLAPRTGRSADVELEQRVEGILHGLARRIERDRRARSRRTRHAERRHVSGERPTRKALDDARSASADTLYVDDRSGAMVVLGDRGRTHFFTMDGRLVSSVRYSRDAIERKVKAELWRPAGASLSEAFRSKLR